MNYLKKLFDWKNHPVRIFYVLIPIVILKFGYLLAYSVAQINVNDNWLPLCSTIVGFIILCFCVWPLRQIVRDKAAEKQAVSVKTNDENNQIN